MIRWRVGWTWWLVAVGTPLAVLAVAAAANVAIWGAPAPVLATIAWSQIALGAAIRFVNPLDGPLGEEPGWRGYALRSCRRGARRSRPAVVLGVLVALWHLPLVASGMLAPVGLPITFAITLVYVWLFNRTGGSVLMTMVFHIAQGTVSYGALGFTGSDAARMDWLVGVLWFALALAVVRARPPGVAGGSCGRRGGTVGGCRPHADRRSAGAGRLPRRFRPGLRAVYSRRQLDRPRPAGPRDGRRDDGGRHGCVVPERRQLRAGRPARRGDPRARCPARAVGRRRGGRAGRAGAGGARRRPGGSDRRHPAPGRRLLRRVRADRVAASPGQPQRPAHDGHRVRLPPLRPAPRGRHAARGHGRELALRPLDAVLHPAGAHLLHGRPAAHRRGPGAARRRGRRVRAARPALAGLLRRPRHAPARASRPLRRPRVRPRPTRALPRDLRGYGGRGRRALAGGLGAGPAGDAAECRRRGLPAAVGRAARRRPRRRRCAPRGPALDRGVLDRAGAGGVPRRPAPVAAGPGRPGRPVRRARHHAARRPAGGAGAGAARPEVRDRLCRPGRRVRRRPRVAGRPARAGVGPVGLAGGARRRPGGRARVRPVARRRPGAGRGRRRGGDDRAGEPASARPVRRPARRAAGVARSASSPRPTPSAGGSSATCTTAPSSGW